MNGLWGSLAFAPPSALIAFAADQRLDGTLRFERGSTWAWLQIQGGLIVAAGANEPRLHFSRFLTSHAKIHPDAVEQALRDAEIEGIPLGQVVERDGLADGATLRATIEAKILQTTAMALRWKGGHFAFDPALTLAPDTPSLAELQAPGLILAASVENEHIQALQARLPDPSSFLQLREGAHETLSQEDPVEASLRWGLREPITLDELLDLVPAGPAEVYHRLTLLLDLGAIELTPFEAPASRGRWVEPPPGTPPPLAPQVDLFPDKISALLREERYEEARRVSKARIRVSENDPIALCALKEAELGIITGLRKRLRLSESIAAVISGDMESLLSLDLSPSARYLLRRLGPGRRLRQVLRLCPLRELDALTTLNDLLEAGLISLCPYREEGT